MAEKRSIKAHKGGRTENLGNVRLSEQAAMRLQTLISETGMKKSDLINALLLSAQAQALISK